MSKLHPGVRDFIMLSPLRVKQKLVPVLILLLAFALRVIALDRIPAGLSHDEAYNGITAMQVLAGDRRIFFEINKGIEPLIIYLEALAFHFLGIGPVPLRLVNVFFGMLTIALIHPFTTRLFGRRVAWLAMAGLAVFFWPIFVSRLTLRAVLLPPLLLLTLYTLWRGLSPVSNASISSKTSLLARSSHRWPLIPGPSALVVQPNLLFLALSGLTAGITMYTYLSSRFVPFIVISVFSYQLIRRKISRVQWWGLLLHFLIWATIFAPLANYFWQHSDSFTRRSSQVTTIPHALNGDFEPMIRNTFRTLGMFTLRGDTTDRYNLDGRPLFDWANGLFFYLGLLLVLWCFLRSASLAGPAMLLLSTFFFMLLPDFITDDSPHFLRTIGAMPVIYIFWALGLDMVGQQVEKLYSKPSIPGLTFSAAGFRPYALHFIFQFSRLFHPLALILGVLTLTVLQSSYDYFGRWAAAPNARYIYGADIAEIADYIKINSPENLMVISAEYYRDLDPFRFTLHFQGTPPFVIWFDGRQTLASPPTGSGLSPRYAFPVSAPPADIWTDFLQLLPQESGQEYLLYRLPATANLPQLEDTVNRLGVNVNNDLILSGYQIIGEVVSGGKFQILLSWRALRTLPPGTDYTFLVRMWDNDGHLWHEADGNGYAPGDWQPGVQALQLLTLRMPGDLPPRTYHFTMQVINRRTRQALPVSTGDTIVPLGWVTAQLAGKARPMTYDQLPNFIELKDVSPPIAPAVALRGYELSRRQVQIGDELSLTLHWQVFQQPQHDYQLQFFLEDDQANVVHSWPALEPAGGEWPTRQWLTNYWVQDKLRLPMSDGVPAGSFRLYARWVKPTDRARVEDVAQADLALGPLKVGSR